MINNWPGVTIASLIGLYLLLSVISSLQSGQVTTTGKQDRQVTWHRDRNPGHYWGTLVVEALCALFCFGSAYVLAFDNKI